VRGLGGDDHQVFGLKGFGFGGAQVKIVKSEREGEEDRTVEWKMDGIR
jgi:hypothetical protein